MANDPLVSALEELDAAQDALELAEGSIDEDARLLRFHSAALDVCYRWRDYNALPVKPSSGPFVTGVRFVRKEDGSTEMETF